MTGHPDAGRDATGPRPPLAGVKVVEFQGSGPGPFAGMLLADMGADVLLVDRVGDPGQGKYGARRYETMMRGKRSVMVDLKAPGAAEAMLDIIAQADCVIDVLRPGAMERLGLGPETCLARAPKLVYGRMTGWGQDGPLAQAAGHDINYLAVSGMLHPIGPAGAPVVPLNLVGDMGGGGMLLAFGIVCALWDAARNGRGQVVDAAMLEGASLLGTMFHGMLASGRWRDERGVNHLDGSAPWYTVYETGDHRFMAVGANEEHFYELFLDGLGLRKADLPARQDRASWPLLRETFAERFRSRTRDEWTEVFSASDACVSPVLSMLEATRDPHVVARGGFQTIAGVEQPSAAPRFSRSTVQASAAPPMRGEGGRELLQEWGFDGAELARLAERGIGFLNG